MSRERWYPITHNRVDIRSTLPHFHFRFSNSLSIDRRPTLLATAVSILPTFISSNSQHARQRTNKHGARCTRCTESVANTSASTPTITFAENSQLTATASRRPCEPGIGGAVDSSIRNPGRAPTQDSGRTIRVQGESRPRARGRCDLSRNPEGTGRQFRYSAQASSARWRRGLCSSSSSGSWRIDC